MCIYMYMYSVYLIVLSEERSSILYQEFADVDVAIPRSFMQGSLQSEDWVRYSK